MGVVSGAPPIRVSLYENTSCTPFSEPSVDDREHTVFIPKGKNITCLDISKIMSLLNTNSPTKYVTETVVK